MSCSASTTSPATMFPWFAARHCLPSTIPTDPEASKCITELMEALDDYIPEPVREDDKPFLDGDRRRLLDRRSRYRGNRSCRAWHDQGGRRSRNRRPRRFVSTKTTCTGVEMFRKEMGEGRSGDNVGCLLRGVKREEIQRGQVLAKPGSINPHTKFEAEVYCLSKDEGGRHTPFFSGYRPQFYFRTTDVTGTANLIGAEMCMPGDNVKVEVELHKPIAMDDGVRFAIREGGRTVGFGRCHKNRR